MTTWKPGDVGVNKGGERFIVTRQGECFWPGAGRDNWHGISGNPVSGDRPVVVVDPESADDIDRLCNLIAEDVDWLALQAALREFANPTPPKPAEPTGHYAVIEDTRGVEWCLTGWDTDYPWQAHYQDGSGESTTYAEIDAVRVLSEGIQ